MCVFVCRLNKIEFKTSETGWSIGTIHSRARFLLDTQAKPRLLSRFFSTRGSLVSSQASDVSKEGRLEREVERERARASTRPEL